MRHQLLCSLTYFILLLFLNVPAVAQIQNTHIVFIEPNGVPDTNKLPVYQRVTDPQRLKTYHTWLDNDAARMAISLYERAWQISQSDQAQPPVYYIALLPGGNNADLGFQLREDEKLVDYSQVPYIKLAPEDWTFTTTFLHETGHVLLMLLNGRREIPKQEIASISHTTAALTDRGTAFDEGFAIHLETLLAHFSSEAMIKDRYDHQRFLFGLPQIQAEYHRHAADLLTFSQTRARYYEVRENNFAFAPAFRGPDYLRVQLEKSRDFASLRDANQLLQAEGFYASFFFSFLVRGNTVPTMQLVHERQGKLLVVLAEMFRSRSMAADSPYLLNFIESYLRKYPAEANEIVDLLMDLSHGVFVDRQAAALWREHYLGSLRLDLAERNNEKLKTARAGWRAEVIKNPSVLYSLLGPQLRCKVPTRSVLLVAFSKPSPLSFDINTVDEGIMRLIPGISDSEVSSWVLQRSQKPFTDVDDFKKRAGLSEQVLASMRF